MVLAAHTHPELVPGERVCDDYVIEGFARGGDGPEVYAARHVASDGARFTVRVVPCRDFPTSTRFLRGMARARRVEHRALAPVVAFEVRDVGAITVQREVAAETLRARLQRGPLSNATVGWLVCEVAAALDALHTARPAMVHGALCPANITFDERAAVVGVEAAGILDALRARRWPGEAAAYLRETGYTSPDEAVERLGPRADTFVLACIAYECLSGEAPFAGRDDDEVQARILSAPPPPLRRRRRELDESVDEVLARAWCLDHQGGYESSFAFAMELARALLLDPTGRALPAHAPPPLHSGMRGIQSESDVPAPADVPDAPWDNTPTTRPPAPRDAETRPAPVDAPTAEELAAAEQVTLAPPSRYRSWVGEVSRSAIPANDAPRVSQLLVPHPLTMATAPPARDPRGADHAVADALRAGLPRAGLVSAAMISASVLLGATLLTAGRLYELHARPATAVREAPATVTPPREEALVRPAPPAPPAAVTAAPIAAPPAPPPRAAPARADRDGGAAPSAGRGAPRAVAHHRRDLLLPRCRGRGVARARGGALRRRHGEGALGAPGRGAEPPAAGRVHARGGVARVAAALRRGRVGGGLRPLAARGVTANAFSAEHSGARRPLGVWDLRRPAGSAREPRSSRVHPAGRG
jgi:serine/threonine protein kinase